MGINIRRSDNEVLAIFYRNIFFCFMFEQMLDREKDKKFDDPSQKEIAYSNHISVLLEWL